MALVVSLGLVMGLAVAAEPAPDLYDQLTSPRPIEGRRVLPPRLSRDADILNQIDLPDGPSKLGLVRQPDGTFRYADRGRRFTATVTPDGRIQFADRWRRPSPAAPRRGRCCGTPAEGFWWAANVFNGLNAAGPLEWLFRAAGVDPDASAKAEFARSSEAFRTKLAIAWHHQLIRTRLRALPAELVNLWGARDLDSQTRRRLLFTRWDECEDQFTLPTEGIPPDAIITIDRARFEAGQQARALIISFIGRHLPPGHGDAYSPTELRALNAQRVSTASFAPYSTTGTTTEKPTDRP